MDPKFTINPFDHIRRITDTGEDVWFARDLMPAFGYRDNWEAFYNVIHKAKDSLQATGLDDSEHFRQVTKMVPLGSGAKREIDDFEITRYGCYIASMNGDSKKPEIAMAQAYFARQTRRQEIGEQPSEFQQRVQQRLKVKESMRSMTDAAKASGVQRYKHFMHFGYQGLYNKSNKQVCLDRGIPRGELLDHIGALELSANDFKNRLTETALIDQKDSGEQAAFDTHQKMGHKVRDAMYDAIKVYPEQLPVEVSIKRLPGSMPKSLPSQAEQPKKESMEISGQQSLWDEESRE